MSQTAAHLVDVVIPHVPVRQWVLSLPIPLRVLLAPNAKLRALVVPQVPEAPEQAARSAACHASCAHHRPVRLSWAKLLKRVFEIDMAHCPNCGGELKVIAAILWGEPGHKRS
jgi:hypothetical protein